MHRHLVLASLLGALAGCLNPDISDEYPLTLEAEALDVDDGGAIDESADDEDEDDAESDDSESDETESDEAAPAGNGRPRRFTRGAAPASARSSSLAAPADNTRAR